ncbi:DUF2914 domain-containing protein [Kaarinaea lacus]
MTVLRVSQRLATFILLLLLSNMTFAEATPAIGDEPVSATDTSTADQASGESTSASEPASAEPAAQQAPTTDAEDQRKITRAQFTTAIADREPTDDIVQLTNDNDKIHFFTELVNFNGQTIKHRWEYEGKEMAEIEFKVEGPRWRIYSSKNIKPEWIGIWNVTILDQDNNPLKVTSFEVVEAATSASP